MLTYDFGLQVLIIACMRFSMQVMELELKKLEDTVKSIHDEMFYLRER